MNSSRNSCPALCGVTRLALAAVSWQSGRQAKSSYFFDRVVLGAARTVGGALPIEEAQMIFHPRKWMAKFSSFTAPRSHHQSGTRPSRPQRVAAERAARKSPAHLALLGLLQPGRLRPDIFEPRSDILETPTPLATISKDTDGEQDNRNQEQLSSQS